MTDLSRYDDWLVWLREQAQSDADIRVVFVGGSAVTGGYDDHSDLDVEVLTTTATSTHAGTASRSSCTTPTARWSCVTTTRRRSLRHDGTRSCRSPPAGRPPPGSSTAPSPADSWPKP